LWNVFPFARSVGWAAVATRPLVLGHRGASRREAENTLAAFTAARELGADGVELDVRRTADGVLVLHHDPARAGVGLLASQPFAGVRAAAPDIPTLAEALDACAGMLVNVEIKCLPWEPDADTADHAVVRAVADELEHRTGELIVSSFDLGAVDACRAYAPALTTALLTSGQSVAAAAQVASEHGHAWCNPDRRAALDATVDEVAAAHAAGVRVSVWTVDDPTEAQLLAAVGVDAIITNEPDVVLAVLTARRS